MFKYEEKFWDWIEQHILELCILIVSVIAIIIRYSFRDATNSDISLYYLPWYNDIKENGGIHALGVQVGDYNMPYQFIIALLTYLPLEPLYAYKLVSCLFDFFLAAVMGYFVYDISKKDKPLRGVITYTIVLFSPMVFLNSSYWGQCDVLYTFFCVASLLALCKDKYKLTYILYGAAFAFKLQAIFLLPFYLFLYFRKKKFSFLYLGLTPLTMILLSTPNLIMGRKILEVFTVYFEQTEEYFLIAMNYPTFWNLFQDLFMEQFYLAMKGPAVAITIIVLGMLMVLWTVKNPPLTQRNIIFMAFLSIYSCVLFLPVMHERYGYLYEILAILILFLEKKTLPFLISMYIISFATYGAYLFFYTTNTTFLSIVNVLTYIGYFCILLKAMLQSSELTENSSEI